MPVIRLAGPGGGGVTAAGQAAGAFDQATAEGRRQTFAREQMAMRLQQQQMQLGAQAQQRDIQNRQTNRSLDIRERQIEGDQNRRRSAAAVKSTGGIPISGAAVTHMVSRLSELNRGAYEQLVPVLRAQLGGRFTDESQVTPEALDQLPNLDQIYATISGPYGHAVKAADVQAVQTGFQSTLNAYVPDEEERLKDPEWAEWSQELREYLTSAERSTGGATMALMAPVYEQFMEEGARIEFVKGERERLTKDWTNALESGQYADVEPDDMKRARRIFSKMKKSDDPQGVFDDAMLEISPQLQRIHGKGQQAGFKAGAVGAATAQVRAQTQAAAQAPAPPRGTDHDAELAERAKPAPKMRLRPLVESGDALKPELIGRAVEVDGRSGSVIRYTEVEGTRTDSGTLNPDADGQFLIVEFEDGETESVSAEKVMERYESAPNAISSDAHPGVMSALGLDDAKRQSIRAELKAAKVDTNNEAAVRDFVERKLFDGIGNSDIYNTAATRGRYTNIQ